MKVKTDERCVIPDADFKVMATWLDENDIPVYESIYTGSAQSAHKLAESMRQEGRNVAVYGRVNL